MALLEEKLKPACASLSDCDRGSTTRASSVGSSRSRSTNFDDIAITSIEAGRRTVALAKLNIRTAKTSDAAAILSLHDRDYVGAHRDIYAEAVSLAASDKEWGDALGNMDFAEVLSGIKKGDQDVRLLVCEDTSTAALVGYILCELRSKGSKKKKQLYCEVVNVVVSESHRGCGAGRLLFEALCTDVSNAAPNHAKDLRLYVAEQNLGPTAWYRRLGFCDSGWQSETVGTDEVKFLRMIRRVH
jgi:ribosomal protein S18 acetylase RimI-like enzyme